MESLPVKTLTRSKNNRVFAGVCGGLGEYFDIDPILVRLLFVVFFLAGGSSVLAYIVLWIVIPEEKNSGSGDLYVSSPSESDIVRKSNTTRLIGILLLFAGLIILPSNLRLISWDYVARLWPMLLIALGVLIIFRRK